MKFSRPILFALLAILSACNKAPQTKEAVKQAVIDHLGNGSGLDVNLMDVDVVSVSFNGDQARATVSFRPKSSPDQGMQMNYTLESKGKKWVVQKKAGGGAGATGPHGDAVVTPPVSPSGDLPPAHPPVNPAAPPK